MAEGEVCPEAFITGRKLGVLPPNAAAKQVKPGRYAAKWG
jgi:hypothetical protein